MSVDSARIPPSPARQLLRWIRRTGVGRKLAIALLAGAVISGLATYGALTGAPPFGPDPQTVFILLNINLVFLLLLGVVVVRQAVTVWASRRKGSAGSRLHVKLVALFGLVAVTPAIVVAAFSAIFFQQGVEGWFSDKVRTALNESQAVAEAYLHEHQQTIRADALAMANDINRAGVYLRGTLRDTPEELNKLVARQAAIRALPEAMVFRSDGTVLARSALSFALEFELIPIVAFERARAGDVPVITSQGVDRVRALVRLDPLVDAYLYVGRFVDSTVLNHIERTRRAVAAYQSLEGHQSDFKITLTMIFSVVAVLLMMAAILVGLTLANRLVQPVSGLIAAAEKVGAGDLGARVEVQPTGDELGTLGRAFNRMTEQLAQQQGELIEANRQLDNRRRFTEAVLGGVSAGVIGLDEAGYIRFPNRSASVLMETNLDIHVGRPLTEVVPEMRDLLDAIKNGDRLQAEGQIDLPRNGRTRTLLTRITAERKGDAVHGYVVTFDDVTELMSAQRKAAWADVARRIAHEIKNPLTPIQLSAERLRRKYVDEIKSDPEVFETCTDTIVRQVSDIGRMVDEFSSFARMPRPTMKRENLVDLCRQAVFLQRSAGPSIDFHADLPTGPVEVFCDGRLIGQALTNILKNASEAIEGREVDGDAPLPPGRVDVRIIDLAGRVAVEVCDNGRGLPSGRRNELTEPYVTSRAKGTGLGLAIVKKIMEDHGGELTLNDRPEGGAVVRLVFAELDTVSPSEEADDRPVERAAASHGA